MSDAKKSDGESSPPGIPKTMSGDDSLAVKSSTSRSGAVQDSSQVQANIISGEVEVGGGVKEPEAPISTSSEPPPNVDNRSLPSTTSTSASLRMVSGSTARPVIPNAGETSLGRSSIGHPSKRSKIILVSKYGYEAPNSTFFKKLILDSPSTRNMASSFNPPSTVSKNTRNKPESRPVFHAGHILSTVSKNTTNQPERRHASDAGHSPLIVSMNTMSKTVSSHLSDKEQRSRYEVLCESWNKTIAAEVGSHKPATFSIAGKKRSKERAEQGSEKQMADAGAGAGAVKWKMTLHKMLGEQVFRHWTKIPDQYRSTPHSIYPSCEGVGMRELSLSHTDMQYSRLYIPVYWAKTVHALAKPAEIAAWNKEATPISLIDKQGNEFPMTICSGPYGPGLEIVGPWSRFMEKNQVQWDHDQIILWAVRDSNDELRFMAIKLETAPASLPLPIPVIPKTAANENQDNVVTVAATFLGGKVMEANDLDKEARLCLPDELAGNLIKMLEWHEILKLNKGTLLIHIPDSSDKSGEKVSHPVKIIYDGKPGYTIVSGWDEIRDRLKIVAGQELQFWAFKDKEGRIVLELKFGK